MKKCCRLLWLCLVFAAGMLFFGRAYAATEIKSRADLEAIADHPTGDYILMSDIALGGSPWTPISFSGSFNGNGHTIWGLNLSGDYSWTDGDGAFLGGNCQIKNLTLSGINIDVSVTYDGYNGYADLRLFGNGGELSSVTNCDVAGSIRVSGSGRTILIENGVEVTANLTITVEGENANLIVFENCDSCHLSGSVSVDSGSVLYGLTTLIDKSFHSTSNATFYVNNNTTDNQAYMIFTGLNDCFDCELHGNLSYDGRMILASGCGGCIVDVTALSDDCLGLSNCNDSSLSGLFYNIGHNSRNEFTPEINGSNNHSSGKFTYQKGEGATAYIACREVLGNGSTEKIDFEIDAGDAEVSISFDGLDENTFHNGNVHVRSDSGLIYVATFGRTNSYGTVTCQSNTGNISIYGGKNNTGEIKAETGGSISIKASHGSNYGKVTAKSTGDSGSVGITGGKYNYADITATGYEVSVTAANRYNSGTISATGVKSASACGVNDLDPVHATWGNALGNTGNITAICTEGQPYNVTSASASTSGVNTAAIFAQTLKGNATASANGGTVRAIAGSTAKAYASSGSAFATGKYAFATGSFAEATSTFTGQHVTTGYEAYAQVYNNEAYDLITMSDDTVMGPYNYNTGKYDYTLFAAAHKDTSPAQEMPEVDDEGLPHEEQDGDARIDVNLQLFSQKTGKEVTAFQQTFGSFSWNEGNDSISDFSEIRMKISVYNDEEKEIRRRFKATLPDGFSYYGHAIVSSKTFDVTIPAGKTKTIDVIVYPLYSEAVECVSFNLSGEIERSYLFFVEQNKNAGLMLMRPTSGVNTNDNNALTERITLNPVSDFLTASTNAYSNRLALLGCCMSQAVYNTNFMENSDTSFTYRSLRNLGFGRIQWYGSDSEHDVAVGFALKTVVNGGEVRDILMVAVRGTVGMEWVGNFNVIGPNSTVHTDFSQCAYNVLQRMEQYFEAYGVQRGSVCAFLCGHSRAGAVVNLLAHMLNSNESGLTHSLTAYTFAAPNCTKSPSPDPNIFNYAYKYDFVPFVPHGDFKRHGVTYFVGGSGDSEAPSAVERAYLQYVDKNNLGGRKYSNVGSKALVQLILATDHIKSVYGVSTIYQNILGYMVAHSKVSDMFIARAHGAENYLAWVKENGISGALSAEAYENEINSSLLSVSASASIEYAKVFFGINAPMLSPCMKFLMHLLPGTLPLPKGASIIAVGCPVNVEVKTPEGGTLARLSGHIVEQSSTEVLAVGDSEHSYLVLPEGTEYEIFITGTDDGEMTINYMYYDEEQQFHDFAACQTAVSSGSVYTMRGIAASGQIPIGQDVPIDEDHFPDATFRLYLSQEWDEDHDGCLSDAERRNVTFVRMSYNDDWLQNGGITQEEMDYIDQYYSGRVTSLQGIEYLTELQYLWCRRMPGMSGTLDLRQNRKLKHAVIAEDQLSEVLLGGAALELLDVSANNLSALDLSAQTGLEALYCGNNQLTELDVSAFLYLDTLMCDMNQLTALDVSRNPELIHLNAQGNQLKSIDLRNNTKLEELYLYSNQLTSLDASMLTNLRVLECLYMDAFSSLNVSGLDKLEALYVGYTSLRSLDVSSLTSLVELECRGNHLTALDISRNTALQYLNIHSNDISSLDLSRSTALKGLSVWNNPIKLLDVSACPNLISAMQNGEYYEDDNRGLADYEYEYEPNAWFYVAYPTDALIIREENANVLRIPSSVRVIEEEAFLGAAADVVIVPDCCERIGAHAFSMCPNLKTAYIPAHTDVADNAFEGSINVQIVRID